MPDINALPVEARSRQPRGAVKLGGVIVPHEAIEVENNAYRAADTFAVDFALNALPTAYGPAWFGSQSEILCEIFVSEDAPSPTTTNRWLPIA
jgi:hypothetical protein